MNTIDKGDGAEIAYARKLAKQRACAVRMRAYAARVVKIGQPKHRRLPRCKPPHKNVVGLALDESTKSKE